MLRKGFAIGQFHPGVTSIIKLTLQNPTKGQNMAPFCKLGIYLAFLLKMIMKNLAIILKPSRKC